MNIDKQRLSEDSIAFGELIKTILFGSIVCFFILMIEGFMKCIKFIKKVF
jgi:hypothetical protein